MVNGTIEDSQQPSVKMTINQNYKGNVYLEVESFDGQSAKAIYGVDVLIMTVIKVTSNWQSLNLQIVDISSEPRKACIVNALMIKDYFNVYDSNGDLVAFRIRLSIDNTYFPDSNSNYNVYATNGYLVSEPQYSNNCLVQKL